MDTSYDSPEGCTEYWLSLKNNYKYLLRHRAEFHPAPRLLSFGREESNPEMLPLASG